MLIALALIWGASFLFIKVAVRELTPATLIVGAARASRRSRSALLVPLRRRRAARRVRQLRANWVWLVVVALVNTAIPFWLLSWGETRIDSGLASIIQASVPIFNARDRVRRLPRGAGDRDRGSSASVVGFVGVALLVGAQPEGKVLGAPGGRRDGVLLRPRRAADRPLPRAGPAGRGRLRLDGDRDARLAARRHRASAGARCPSWKTIGSVLALGIPGTALALPALLRPDQRGAGAAYASLVTYLIPPIALAYGAIFLGERFGASAFGGLALILARRGARNRSRAGQTRRGSRSRSTVSNSSPRRRASRRTAGKTR